MPQTYEYDALYDAYLAVTQEKVSISAAAKKFGVPRRTLGDRVNGLTRLECMSVGPQPMFNEEEEFALTRHIVYMAELGYGYSRREVRDIATGYAISLGKRTENNPLGKTWFHRFMQRWPNIKARKASALDTYRAKASSRENVTEYFTRLQKCLEEHKLMDRPQLIYNIDEKALAAHHQPPKIVLKAKGPAQAVTPPRGTITTLIGAGSAIGQMIPPFFIFKGTRMQPNYLGEACAGSSGCVSESGWSNSIIFKRYLEEHFLKYAQRPSTSDPILILYDGHKSHVTLDVMDWAKQHNIVLFVLPAHTSHFLQPLDICCFGPLETAFTKLKHAAVRGHQSGNLSFAEIAALGSKAYQEALKPANLASGFRKAGIYPFSGIDAVTPDRLAPATAFKPADSQSSPGQAYFADKESILDVKRVETKKRKVLGAVAGGKEITSKEVSGQIRDHIQGQKKKMKIDATSFDQESSCCICLQEDPPVYQDENHVQWAGCDRCPHWVHVGLCIPIAPCSSKDEFLCPCCASAKEL